MKHILLSLFSIALLSLPATAIAACHGHGQYADCPLGAKECKNKNHCPTDKQGCDKSGIANMDSNTDGKVSLKEFTKAHNERIQSKFKYLDANADGFITDADRDLRRSKRSDDYFAAADTNNDGALSKAEFTAAKRARWQKKKSCAFSDKK